MNANQKLNQAKFNKWTAIIRECKASDLTVDQWCKENNCSKNAYYYWQRKIKDSIADAISPEIVPILPALPQSHENSIITVEHKSDHLHDSHNLSNSYNSPQPISIGKNVTIQTNDIKIELSSSVSEDTILHIIKVVCHA